MLRKFLRLAEGSGMTWVACGGCWRRFLTRNPSGYCPPCRGEAKADELTEAARDYWRSRLGVLLAGRAADDPFERNFGASLAAFGFVRAQCDAALRVSALGLRCLFAEKEN